MFIFDVLCKEKVYQIVVSDLRSFGVKYRHKKIASKTEKPERNGKLPQQIFKVHLSCLPLDLVNLSSGAMVHVPLFVSQAASYLLKHIDLEGIFRKAGSKTRQREISTRLDNGGAFGEKDHGIDIANCLKTFFRDLPEPLIPYAFHDLFVRCVVLKKNRVEALLLACLLLPPLHLNTLAFIMEFLKKVASYEELNKMGACNLATVIGPNIMPLREKTMVAVQSRLEMHLVVVQILLENAEKIGVLPENISDSISAESELINSIENVQEQCNSNLTKIKKKNRSGSFTRKPHLSASNLNLRMLSGLKRMVGKNNSPPQSETVSEAGNSVFSYTPSHKTGKKRKVTEAESDEANSKKQNKLLAVIPERTSSRPRNSFLFPDNKRPKKPSDKMEKAKKGRFSFDRFVSRGRQKMTETETATCKEEPPPNRGRSWSVSSRHSEFRKSRRSEDVFTDSNVNLSDIICEQVSQENKRPNRNRTSLESSSVSELKNNEDEEYIKIPKSEYLEIKNRVSAIESQIFQEFQNIPNETSEILRTNSVTNVQNEYEKTLEETSIENTMNADHLAKRLGKELRIRRSSEHKIIRSPSARKIAVLRRRSQEKPISKRIRRTSSWNISDRPESHSLKQTVLNLNNIYSDTNLNRRKNNCSKSKDIGATTLETDLFCSEETNARLTYLQEQLHALITHTAEHTKDSLSDEDFNTFEDDVFHPRENKLNLKLKVKRASSFHGSEFIDNSRYFNERVKELKKSSSQQNVILTGECLPSEKKEKIISWKDAEKYFKTEGQTMTPVPVTGRASVAKLRTQNAGMVLAKAKLFDEATRSLSHSEASTERRIIQNQDINRRQSTRLKAIKNLNLDTTDSPRRAGCRRKKTVSPKNSSAKIRIMKSPNTIKMELTLVSSQETPVHRKCSDSRRNVNYQKENKGMKTPTARKETAILQNSNVNIYNPDVNYKTPLIKQPLSIKTPRSAKSLARRPAVEVRRTPLKAIGLLATPRRQSPRSILKTSHLSSR